MIDYSRERFEDKPSGYDFAFDLLGGETLACLWSVLKPGGRVASIAGVPEPVTAQGSVTRQRARRVFWVARGRTSSGKVNTTWKEGICE